MVERPEAAGTPVYCDTCESKTGVRVETVMVNKSPSNFGYFKCGCGHITRKKIEDYENIPEKDKKELDKN